MVLSIIPMIRPFEWQRLFPILPARMVVFLDAPVPFIVGQLQLFLMLSTGGKKKGDCSGILSPSVTRDDNGMFCVGQSLRIRIGPLKGYICRVLAVRRSDVTVKLDSKHKIITVKSEHLSEVHERNPAIANGEDSGSVKPFRFLEEQDGLNSWMNGAALPSEDNKWNAGGSTERELYSNNISGKFPSELGNLTNLFSLDLCLNNLSGPIPDTLYKLQKLCFLRLNNSLTGLIPYSLTSIGTNP